MNRLTATLGVAFICGAFLWVSYDDHQHQILEEQATAEALRDARIEAARRKHEDKWRALSTEGERMTNFKAGVK